jgi:WD40 repeat protein
MHREVMPGQATTLTAVGAMLGKTPGQVLCAHCARLPSAAVCACCSLLVCAACAADWTTCADVPGVELAMTRKGALVAVDGTGTRGVVGRQPTLMQQVFNALPKSSLITLSTGHEDPLSDLRRSSVRPHVCRDGHLVWSEQVRAGDSYDFFVRTTWPGEHEFRVDTTLSGAVTPDDRMMWDFYDNFLYTFDLPSKSVIRFVGLPRSLAPLSASLDGPVLQLAIGLWYELRLYRAADEQVELLAKTEVRGEVGRCRTRNGRVVALASEEGTTTLRAFELRDDQLRPDPAWEPQVEPRAAVELSRDGRFCAVADRDGAVLVRDFEKGTTQTLQGHRAPVSLLRFTDGEAALISASPNGQVLIRKRAGDVFAERCVRVVR